MNIRLWFDELINRIAFTLQREPLLIILGPMALIAVIVALRAWRSRARPPTPPMPEALEAAPAEAELSALAPTSGPYLVERILIREGHYLHEEARSKKLNFMWGHYRIREDDLYEVKPGLLDNLTWRLRGISKKYLIIFWDMPSYSEAVKIPVARIQPALLSRVRTSRILSRAMREIFSTSIMENKGIIFIVIAFGIIAVVWLKLQGKI